jgi:hypothetical protein
LTQTRGFEGVCLVMRSETKDKRLVYATKRCPECYTYVSLRVTQCPSCRSRLGEVDSHGMAKRTVNWTAYLSAFFALLVLGIYIWWAFLR